MKQLTFFPVFGIIVLLLLVGCNKSFFDKTNIEGSSLVSEELLSQFPAGIWECKSAGWQITLESDSNIVSIIHPLGISIDIAEGGAYEEGTGGASLAWALGPCSTKYDPNSRILEVGIVTDYFSFELPGAKLEGKSRDEFSGKISETGNTWDAKWINYGQVNEFGSDMQVTSKTLTFTRIK